MTIVPAAGQARRRQARAEADRALRDERGARRDRRRSAMRRLRRRGCGEARCEAATARGRAARHPPAASAARAARPRVPGPADPRRVRRLGAHRVVTERPYELTSVFGVGFLIADRIARGLGAPATAPSAPAPRALHVLSEAERSGSTCLPIELAASSRSASCSGSPAERRADRAAGRGGDLSREERWIYRRQTAELEAELAERVARARRRARRATRLPAEHASARPDGPRAHRASSSTGVAQRGCRTACR